MVEKRGSPKSIDSWVNTATALKQDPCFFGLWENRFFIQAQCLKRLLTVSCRFATRLSIASYSGEFVGPIMEGILQCNGDSPISCFNPFSFFQIVDNWATKNVNVRPSTTRKWTFNPDDVSTEETQPNLVSNSRWQVFVRIAVSTRSFYTKVGAINRNEAVVSNIILFSVFPDNLQSAKQMLDCKHAK